MLPIFTRAREYHVYDRGKRYLDFWQEGGCALLGHRPLARSELKRQIDRGLLASYPTRLVSQTEGALGTLLEGFVSFRWYIGRDRSEQVVASYLEKRGFVDRSIADPALGESSDCCMVWRPYLEESTASAQIVRPVIPMPGTGWITILAFREEMDPSIPPSDAIPPFILAAIKRMVFDLIKLRETIHPSHWNEFDSSLFRRRGPYLQPIVSPAGYTDLYRDAFDHGIMFSPDYDSPSIIPGTCDPGEIRIVQRIFARHTA